MAETIVQYQMGADTADVDRAFRDVQSGVQRLGRTIQDALTQGGQRGASALGNEVTKGLKDSERQASAIGTGVGRAFGRAIGVGLGAVLSGAALNKALEQAIDVGKLAQDTRLSASQVSSLQQGGRQNGAEPSEIDGALKAFSEVSKKAKADAEEFYKALGNIGPGFVKAFETAPTQAERLRVISDALQSTDSEVKKAQLSLEAFGTDNERVIATLGGGRTALDAYQQSARALGVEIDDAMVAKARSADQTLSQLSSVISGNLRAVLVDIAPVIANIASQLGGLAEAASRAISAIAGVKFATNNVLRENAADARANVQTADAVLGTKDGYQKRGALFGGGFEPKPEIVAGRKAAAARLLDNEVELANRGEYDDPRDLRRKADTAGAIQAAQRNAFKPRPSLSGGGGGGGSKGGGAGGADEEEQAQARLEKYIETLQRQGQVLDAQIATFGQSNAVRKAAEEIARAQVDLEKLDADAREKVIAGIQRETAANEQKRETLERLNQTAQAAKQATEFFGQTFASAIGDIIFNGAKASDVVKNLAKSLGQAALQAILIGQGPLAGIFGTQGQNGAAGGIFGAIFKGLFSGFGVPGRAGGGYLPRGFTMVGENGPEALFNNGSGIGRVYPSGGGSSGVGGYVFAPTINAQGADRAALQSVQAELRSLNLNFERRVIAASRNQSVRGTRP